MLDNSTPPNALTAREAARKIREGRLSSVDLVKACLQRIRETDDQLKAWVHLDEESALKQAEALDDIRRSGRAIGPLHGVPVGLKDIIDTKDEPCRRGSPVFTDRVAEADAAIVERLREAGAVILGKTATTEFAFVHPTETKNPHNPAHSPGGSSSGSAAAVAAFHVPLAIGTQTNGSVIRPASFCGTFGFKPTRGVIPRRGVFETSRSLDQIGVFARDLHDAALLADVIGFYDPSDSLSFPFPRPAMLAGSQTEAPVEPALAWLDMGYHDRLSADSRAGFDEIIEILGDRIERLPAHERMDALIGVQATIHEYEIWMHNGDMFTANWDQISATLKPVLERAQKISQAQYEDAIAVKESAEAFFGEFYNDYDAVLAPSAIGEAPLFGGSTGDPVCCTIWTLCGLPAVSVPLLVGENNLPIGVQLIGATQQDDRLMRTTNWLLNALND